MDQGTKRQIRSFNFAGNELEIEIRQLVEKDIPTIISIAKDSFPKVWKTDEFLYFINHAHGLCLGAFVKNELIGYLLNLLVQGELDVISVAIAPKHRRLHVAELLMNCAWEHDGVTGAFLEVESTNLGAIKLYEKLGFTNYGLRKKYYEGQRDAVLMKKRKS